MHHMTGGPNAAGSWLLQGLARRRARDEGEAAPTELCMHGCVQLVPCVLNCESEVLDSACWTLEVKYKIIKKIAPTRRSASAPRALSLTACVTAHGMLHEQFGHSAVPSA